MTDRKLKRPRDPAQLAKLIVDIASGEVEDCQPTPLTKKQATELGGRKRAEVLPRKT
jgi:hypothetical protein